ncbi:hypothetical protein E2C01_068167 [Portunus trituberculatus]|uniref:Uncharacterized protein n=1 Tax=Portunus trituberculatus TaxID=210409 RepID=A0A5B7HX64_PORTR|nr:hypothetical protein [Portunus trituberculatus]
MEWKAISDKAINSLHNITRQYFPTPGPRCRLSDGEGQKDVICGRFLGRSPHQDTATELISLLTPQLQHTSIIQHHTNLTIISTSASYPPFQQQCQHTSSYQPCSLTTTHQPYVSFTALHHPHTNLATSL